MSPLTHALTLAVSLAPSSADYGLSPELTALVKRIGKIWQCASLRGDLSECARNALAVVCLLPSTGNRDSDDDAIAQVFADALLHRRREPGFERVSEYTAPFLGQQAMFLWRSYEENARRIEETGRYRRLTAETIPCPPPTEGEHHDFGCHCPECDELDDEHVEGPDYAYEREHCAARLG
jgi:hypothetical protein